MQPYAWEELKRTLFAREIKIEAPFQSYVSTVSLEPEPIPLRVKVDLIGDRRLYYMLAGADPEFDELFKIAADLRTISTASGDRREICRDDRGDCKEG